MTTAPARAASRLLSTISVRAALLAGTACALMIGSTQSALAACTGDGNANTCVLVIGPAGAGQEDIATGSIDALGDVDTLQFSGSGLTLNANAIGTTIGTPATVRFANFENATVLSGSDLTLTGSTSDTIVSLNWLVEDNADLIALGGNAIGNNSAVTINGPSGYFQVGGNSLDETIGSLAGSGIAEILNGRTLIAGGNNGSTTFSGEIAGVGGKFTKTGSGKMILTGATSFTGLLTVAGGILEVGPGGSIASAGGVATVLGAQLTGKTPYTINGGLTNLGRVTGDVTINGNVSSANGMLPGATSIPAGGTDDNPGQSMGTIQINGNYTALSTGAYFGMFVDLDNHTQDLVNINGDVTGSVPTWLYVVEFDSDPDAGAPTTGNGILMVNVEAGHTVNANAFRQGYAINSGAYQYLFRYIENYSGGGGDDGFFLQSFVRDEVIAQPALLTAGQTLVSQCFRDGQRIPDSPKGATYGRAWAAYHQGSTSFGADTGIEMDEDFSCSTGGMDWRMGYGWFGGISGGFGDATVDFTTDAGPAKLEGDARLVELYASFTSSAFFVNLSAGYSDIDWTLDGTLIAPVLTSATGIVASAQAGVALALSPFAVKLIGAVNYDDTNCGDDCLGVAVSEDTGLVEAVGTVRIDGAGWGGAVRPWLSASYSDVINGGANSVTAGTANPVTISSDGNREMLSIDGGLQTYLDENFALFADGGYRESLAKDVTGYKAGVGLKLYW